MELSIIIQTARRNRQWIISDLAKATGFSVGTLRAWEQGRRTPSGEALRALEKVLPLGGTWLDDCKWVSPAGRIYTLAIGPGFKVDKAVSTQDSTIKNYAERARAIYENRTAGDFTWEGFLSCFLADATRKS